MASSSHIAFPGRQARRVREDTENAWIAIRFRRRGDDEQKWVSGWYVIVHPAPAGVPFPSGALWLLAMARAG